MTRGDLHDELVAYALGSLDGDEAARVAARVDEDPACATELAHIRRHLALHEAVPVLAPAPPLWQGIRARLDEEPTAARRPLLRRLWMPAAAAALVAAALFWPGRTPAPEVVHGTVAHSAGGTYASSGISRLRLRNGVLVTLDTDTVMVLSGPERLALRAGRVFLDVPPGRDGFAVEAPGLAVTTLGTAFSVGLQGEAVTVAVERGRVRCADAGGSAEVGAGSALRFRAGAREAVAEDPCAWFRIPAMSARVLAPDRIRVVLSNEMPDPITLAPPTGGEPLFFATIGNGHTYPLTPPSDSRLRSDSVTLARGGSLTFDLRLPEPVPGDQALFVTCRANGRRVEALR